MLVHSKPISTKQNKLCHLRIPTMLDVSREPVKLNVHFPHLALGHVLSVCYNPLICSMKGMNNVLQK